MTQRTLDQKSNRTSRSGFTLVELLVVIGIIALLISILMPSLNKARKAAVAVTCASQERQIGQAMYLYMNDNKGLVPYGYVNLTTPSGWVISWDDEIDNYFMHRNLSASEYGGEPQRDCPILRCPNDRDVPASTIMGAGRIRRTYSMVRNHDFASTDPTGAHLLGRGVANTQAADATGALLYPANVQYKLTQIHHAANQLMIAEVALDQNVIGYGGYGVVDTAAQQTSSITRPLHGSRFNYLFCDGHVDLLNPLETIGTGTLANPLGMWTVAEGD